MGYTTGSRRPPSLCCRVRSLKCRVSATEESDQTTYIHSNALFLASVSKQQYWNGHLAPGRFFHAPQGQTLLVPAFIATKSLILLLVCRTMIQDLPTRLEDDVTGTNTASGVWFNDGQGHGTHCAGTIGAVGDNGQGVVGIRRTPSQFRFHIGKGLSNEGSGYESAILEAVSGCVDSGARVVSMSLGGPGSTKTARNFYQDVYNEGVLIVAAAGNDGNSGDSFPASYPSVLSVAAVDRNETRPEFSQCNSQVEIAAPGVDVLSTIPGNKYGFSSGTSKYFTLCIWTQEFHLNFDCFVRHGMSSCGRGCRRSVG